MNSPKFKVGDRVVMTEGEHLAYYIATKAGWAGVVVEEIDPDGRLMVKWDEDKLRCAVENHLELELVYNSPLYQALK